MSGMFEELETEALAAGPRAAFKPPGGRPVTVGPAAALVLISVVVAGCRETKRHGRQPVRAQREDAALPSTEPEGLPPWAVWLRKAPWRLIISGNRVAMLTDHALLLRERSALAQVVALPLGKPQGIVADPGGGIWVIDAQKGFCHLAPANVAFECRAAQVEISAGGCLKRVFVDPASLDFVVASVEKTEFESYRLGGGGMVGPTRISGSGNPGMQVAQQAGGALVHAQVDDIVRGLPGATWERLVNAGALEEVASGPDDSQIYASAHGEVRLVELVNPVRTTRVLRSADKPGWVQALASTPARLGVLVMGAPLGMWALEVYSADGKLLFESVLPGTDETVAAGWGLAISDDIVAVAHFDHIMVWDPSGKLLHSDFPKVPSP